MIGADIFLKSLEKEGVKIMYGYPGGVAIPIYDRMKDHSIKHVLVRNEQAAALAADAHYRVTGKPGVCIATSGPGATNLITGIANAHLDSIGMVAITCQVATTAVGTDAFQEIDITGVTHSITKHSYFVDNIDDLPRIIKEAFYIASSGRPGPVHIDIPVDVQKAIVEKFEYPKTINLPGYKPEKEIETKNIKKAIELLKKSARPVALVGHGVLISKAGQELKKFIEDAEIPVITTLLGIGSIPESHPLNFGMLGMHGMAYANFAVHNADLIIGIGMRFDDRITGKLDEFAKDANVIHIDIDPAEIGKNTIVDVPLLGDCGQILKELNKANLKKNHGDWLKKIRLWEQKYKLENIKKESRSKVSTHLMAQDIIRKISEETKGEATVVADVGQNEMWTSHYYEFSHPNQLLSSGGLGTMGYSLPASVGAKLADPKKDVWAIMGDGGFQMNMQELGTIMQEKLPIKIVILNNGYLGMVRQWQELFYDKNYASTKLDNPDFVAIAKAYGIEAHRIEKWQDAQKYIKQAANNNKAIFLEFMIGPEDNVFPMVAPGGALKETRIK